MTLSSFRRELYRSRLTLKGLETDTLYLVFKDRIPNCIWIAYQTTLTRCKQTGILTNDPNSVKRPRLVSPIYPENKKGRNLLAMLRGNSDSIGRHKFPVLKPLDALPMLIAFSFEGMGIIGTKFYLSIAYGAHNQIFISLREARIFKSGG